jgi:phosphate:Na+ symporter
MRLFAKGKWAGIGYAIAGFGLLFVGISMLQEGMTALQGVISFDQFPADTWTGRLQLLALGMIFTVITQSSSAGVAAALTAMFAGLISFEQAAAMVIGMDIGTTVKVAVVTIGSGTEVRRTGYSHLIYNLFTGAGALLLITPYTWMWETVSPGSLQSNAEIALVGFHTLFNGLGVMIVLPIAKSFSRLMYRIVPSQVSLFTEALDDALIRYPDRALTAAQQSVQKEFLALLQHLNALLGASKQAHFTDLTNMQLELDRTHAYVDLIHLRAQDGARWERLLAVVQMLDHLQRFHERCDEEKERALTAVATPKLSALCKELNVASMEIIENIEKKRWPQASETAKKVSHDIHRVVHPYRLEVAEAIASGEVDVAEGTDRLEAIRWLRRVSRHIAHSAAHLNDMVLAAGK